MADNDNDMINYHIRKKVLSELVVEFPQIFKKTTKFNVRYKIDTITLSDTDIEDDFYTEYTLGSVKREKKFFRYLARHIKKNYSLIEIKKAFRMVEFKMEYDFLPF